MTFEDNTNNFSTGDQPQFKGFDSWNPTLDDETRSRNSSTSLISPSSDLNMQSMNDVYGLSNHTQGKETASDYLYNVYGKSSTSSASGSTSTSGSSFSNSFNNGNIFPIDTSYSTMNMNTNDFMNSSFQDLTGNEYLKSAAALQAAQNMFGNYTFANQQNLAPTSATPQALFQNNLQDIPIDQTSYPTNTNTNINRSPSPLFEVDEASSPELTEIQQISRRRASESIPAPSRNGMSKRRGYSISIPQDGRSHLDSDEKASRAAAAEGLNKGDKRRMQNKLAQRAFRARSKIVNKHAAGRLEDLEELTEQQTTRIGHLTEMVGRLQKENYALKSSKFQEAFMKGGMP